MLFPMRFNTPFRMFPLLTVQGGFVHVDMRFNFENCYKLSELRVLPLIDDFALPLCERSGDVANRNIVVILSGSTYGYIRRYNVPAFSEAGIESIRFRSISKRNFWQRAIDERLF